jgi:heme/copper-type cytochrome/quinol oxidase subunit 2
MDFDGMGLSGLVSGCRLTRLVSGLLIHRAAILLTILLVLGVLGLIIAFFLRYRRRTDGRTLLPDDEEDDEDIEL